MAERSPAAPRCAAIVGPYLTGKTTLLESLLFATGAVGRKGSAREGNTVGDSAAEARARKMSVEVSAASTEFLGERWTFLDCPGSVELSQEAQSALMTADAAIVVCEAETAKALMLAPLFKFLDDRKIPHMLFVNKIDTANYRVREVLAALQTVSSRPLVLREVPLRSTDSDGGGDRHRLCRSRQRARLWLQAGAALRADQDARGGRLARAGGAARAAGIPRRLRRQAAGAAARGCGALARTRSTSS